MGVEATQFHAVGIGPDPDRAVVTPGGQAGAVGAPVDRSHDREVTGENEQLAFAGDQGLFLQVFLGFEKLLIQCFGLHCGILERILHLLH